ncbi:MAG: ester cyclase [Syntrophales bacterium LBB04]|nr:ester cyclase [Syntrophales bacterium LBB04]
MTTDKNKALMRLFLEKLDKDISAIEEYFIPDCVAHLPGIPDPTNREGFRQFVAMLYAAFPDLHLSMEDQIAESDKVANHVNVYGTHRGDFQGIPPTGKQVEFKDFFITRIQGDKVVELWAQFDALSLLQQLGVFSSTRAKLKLRMGML